MCFAQIVTSYLNLLLTYKGLKKRPQSPKFCTSKEYRQQSMLFGIQCFDLILYYITSMIYRFWITERPINLSWTFYGLIHNKLCVLHTPSTHFWNLDALSPVVKSIKMSVFIVDKVWVDSTCDTCFSLCSKALNDWVINLQKYRDKQGLENDDENY